MRLPRADKIALVASLLVFAFLYGFGARDQGWFPSEWLVQARQQAASLLADRSDRLHFLAERVYDRAGARTPEAEAMFPGLTMVATVWRDSTWTAGLRLLDSRGSIVHEWRVDPVDLFGATGISGTFHQSLKYGAVHGFHLFPDGDVLVNVSYAGTARMDACGRPEWSLAEGGHHSITPSTGPSFWIPGVTLERRRGTPNHPDGLPGIHRPGYQDRLLRVSEEGEVLDDVSLLDVIYASDLERYVAKFDLHGLQDVTHLNDIEVLGDSIADAYPLFESGDLLLSLNHFDLVFVLDPDTKEVKWHLSEPFIRQHDPDFMGGGWIGVFDNNVDRTDRGTMLGGSRVVSVQPHTDSTKVLFPTSRSEPLYTPYAGEWQLLPNGNLLLTESAAGRVVEVASDGRTVWEWVAEPWDASTVPEVSQARRYSMSREDVASWPCSRASTDGDRLDRSD